MALNIRPISDELQKIAIEELNEDPNRISKDLEAIREWIKKTPHLNSRTDDQFLVNVLRGCKYSLEKTKDKIDTYWTLKTAIPEFFANRDPNDSLIEKICKAGISLPLPLLSDSHPRFIMSRLGVPVARESSIADIMKVSLMVTEALLLDNDVDVIMGHIVIVDLEGVGISFISQSTPQIIKKMTSTIATLPIRTKAIHFVNPPMGIEAIFKMFSSFLGEKIRSRIQMHQSFESLHKYIPKSILPKDYGGEYGWVSEMADDLYQNLMSKRQYYLEESQYGSNETLRLGPPKNSSTLFGVEGSFRSLNID